MCGKHKVFKVSFAVKLRKGTQGTQQGEEEAIRMTSKTVAQAVLNHCTAMDLPVITTRHSRFPLVQKAVLWREGKWLVVALGLCFVCMKNVVQRD